MPSPPPLRDLVDERVRLLLVGINPGLRSAAVQRHFAGPGNRFWPALHAAGITPVPIGPEQQERLLEWRVGLTNMVARPSARAGDLHPEELHDGGRRLLRLVARLQPAAVAVLGVTAFRIAFASPRAILGPQPSPPGAAPHRTQWWVLHNPSGLNAHARPADHAAGLQAVAAAAGVAIHPPGIS